MGIKEDWNKYKERLESYGYTEEQLIEVEKVRENYDHCNFDMFQELFLQGIVTRTIKLRKKRNLYVCDSGKFWYLNHYKKEYQYIGFMKNEEDGQV